MAHLAATATDLIGASGDISEAHPLIRRPSRTVENGAIIGWNRTREGRAGMSHGVRAGQRPDQLRSAAPT
jgi:hypothetical protein